MTISRNGTDGRVYGGDCNLIHVADGNRETVGAMVADFLDHNMRVQAVEDGRRNLEDASFQKLCPGCYMIVGVNMLATLAQDNGQPITELAATMVAAWQHVLDTAKGPEDYAAAHSEEISIILDPEGTQ